MKVIGLVGQRLSGKNLSAYRLREEHGFRVLDFTVNLLAPALRRERKRVTRENLTDLSMSLREKHGTDFLARKLRERIGRGKYVITGVRFPEEAIYLKKEFGKDFVLVGIKCNPKIRYGRINRKKPGKERKMTYGNFLRKEELPTEKIISETMKLAKFTVTNEKTKEALYAKIDQVVGKII